MKPINKNYELELCMKTMNENMKENCEWKL